MFFYQYQILRLPTTLLLRKAYSVTFSNYIIALSIKKPRNKLPLLYLILKLNCLLLIKRLGKPFGGIDFSNIYVFKRAKILLLFAIISKY